MPRIVACGTRRHAFDDFCTAFHIAKEDEFVMLLVDSESPVEPGTTCWTHLEKRDKWVQPAGADKRNVHLMVQCMESWFMSDKEALSAYYSSGFVASALPANSNIEDIPKSDIFKSLEQATRNTQKGKYGKGKHSFEILALIDPQKVIASSRHASELLATIIDILDIDRSE